MSIAKKGFHAVAFTSMYFHMGYKKLEVNIYLPFQEFFRSMIDTNLY